MPMRIVVFALLIVLFLILLTPFLIICAIAGIRDPVIAFGKWAVRVSLWVLDIKLEVAGLEFVAPKTPYIFMCNHLSFLDGPIVIMAIPRPVRVILKKSIFRIPVLGIGMRFIGFVPVDRKGAQGGKQSIERAAGLMRERGYSFLVFPEGTRSRDGKMQAFRRGGFFLALESQAPIVPMTIQGTFKLMPRGQWYARKGEIRIAFHAPIQVKGYTAATMGVLMDRVQEAIL